MEQRICDGLCLKNILGWEGLGCIAAAAEEFELGTSAARLKGNAYTNRADAVIRAAESITLCNGVGSCGATVEIPA